MSTLDDLMNIIGYRFKNPDLLREAIVHPSNRMFQDGASFNYERLEFLGDAILGFVIADILFAKHRFANEGDLSRRLSNLVSRKTCGKIAKSMHLSKFLILSHGEEKNGGRLSDASISNALEAIIAAIFVDGGIVEARNFITRFWLKLVDENSADSDPKSVLQEFVQSKFKSIPEYRVLKISGPDHVPEFEIEVKISGLPSATGTGKSKKDAEKSAAQKVLDMIKYI